MKFKLFPFLLLVPHAFSLRICRQSNSLFIIAMRGNAPPVPSQLDLDRRTLAFKLALSAFTATASSRVLASTASSSMELGNAVVVLAVLQLARGIQATSIESAQVVSGKYPQPSRRSLKKVVGLMLRNFDLQRNLVIVSGAVPAESVAHSSELAQEALESLAMLAEYPNNDLLIDKLNASEKDLALKGLSKAKSSMIALIALLPENDLEIAGKKVKEESLLDKKDFGQVFGAS